MSEQSFDRIMAIRIFATVIGETNGLPQISHSNGYTEFPSVQSNGASGFRIKTKCVLVQPTQGFNTNQITTSIYNLNANSRAIIESKVGTKIAIFAGYQGNAKQAAIGDILWARSHKEGPDYITEIVAGDSHFGHVNGEIHQSFSGATTYKQAIDACLTALEDSQIFRGTINYPDGGWNQGIVLNGSPIDELTRICSKTGRSFSIVAGAANIIPFGADNGSPVVEISKDSGMIGIPEVQPPGAIGVIDPSVPVSPDNAISFTHLFSTELALSQRVRIKSKFINGDYIIGRVVHDLDSWSGPFFSRCEAFKVQANAG